MRANTLLALGRLKPGQMNKTETAYRDHLRALKAAGEVLDFRFEAITLKLAQDLRYTPDFFVLKPDGSIEFHEVKEAAPSSETTPRRSARCAHSSTSGRP